LIVWSPEQRRWLVGAALAILMATAAFALDPSKPLHQYRYELWEEEQGLPHYSVNGIAQGSEGYLWLATYYGLVRFDGQVFKVFDRSNTPALESNQIWRLARDREGTLWIGSSAGLYSFRNNTFTKAGFPGLRGLSIRGLHAAADGELLLGTHEHGAFVLRNGSLEPIGDPRLTVRALCKDRAGDIWLGTNSGLYRFHAGKLVKAWRESDGLPGERILALHEGSDGTMWVGSQAGLSSVRNGVLRTVPEPGFRGKTIWTIENDRQGSIWFGMLSGGLARYSGGRFEFARSGLIATTAVTAFYEDREGSLWLGASGAGLGRLRDVPFRTMGQAGSFGNKLAQSVLAARDGTVWAGFNGGGLTHLTGSGEVIRRYTRDRGLPSNDVWCLHEDREGAIWAGTYEGIVLRIHAGRVQPFGKSDGIPAYPMMTLATDRHGGTWIGTMGGGLVSLRQGKTRTFTVNDGLAGNHVRAIHEAADGKLWIGTEHGLSVLENGRFTNYGKSDGLSGEFVFCIREDSDRYLWIGTFDGGLTRYRDGRFIGFDARAGFPTVTVFDFLEDRHGFAWISSSTGIFRLPKRDLSDFADGRLSQLRSWSYGVPDGLDSRECNGGHPAATITPDGRLWFPTMKGLASVQPASLAHNPVPPPVLIDRVSAGDVEYPLANDISLPAGTRNVDIQYTGLSLIATGKVRFRHRLTPLEKEWVEAGTRRRAFYANLPPGSYRFEVIAANNDGLWNRTGASLGIELRPHIYQTAWFLLLCLAALAGMAWGFERIRMRRLRQHNQELEQRVGERTQRLEKTNRDMVGLIEELKVARALAEQASVARSHFVANVSHEIRTPMNGILGLLGLTLATPLSDEQKEYLRLTEQSAETLLHLINDVLDFSKIDSGHTNLESAPFRLHRIVEDTLAVLAPKAAASAVALACHFAPDVPEVVAGDEVRLRQVILNLVGNSVKFTHNGSVDVRVGVDREDANGLVLSFRVEDTGIGIPSDKLAIIFEPFRQADTSTTRQYGGTGLGLAICSRLIEAMKGEIHVESEVGRGTCFRFTATMRRADLPHPKDSPIPLHLRQLDRPFRVLLAEDNFVNQKVAVNLLRRQGCEVDVAGTGVEALGRIETTHYDLVLMDVQMPEMDGLEAIRRIREREKQTGMHLPVIALTAHAMAGDEERCRQAGMDGYLSKPFDPQRLAEVVENIAASHA
jgi:signal transduction histidine kinase/ligand-binding sensor domain-containing protein/ActR/RegA family two-component response regulator